MRAMADGTDDDLALARAETRILTDQLRQARADLHRLGIADQNRALLHAAVSGAVGLRGRAPQEDANEHARSQ